ncbi:major facilitator superfamily protein [Coniochaeta sp. 2T2.1]|nr:major facilitator superfamily protein [Coniochaeta sp. 2T2.1]
MTQQDAAASSLESKEASADAHDATTEKSPPHFKKGPRFFIILFVLALTSLLTSLEATVTSTALPSIVADLGGGDNYIWISNAYFLTIATNMAAMIGGRAVQGIGGSGIGVLCEVVICDLVPLRERGTYMGMVLGMVGLGAALGPLFGGLLVSYSTWRWAFYMALPIGGVSLVLLFAFLHVKYDKSQTLATKLSSLDWLGNALFIGGSTPVLIALSWAGGQYAWSSYQVLVPLLVGLATMGGFIVLEGNARLAPNPIFPLHLFGHSITAIVFLLTFVHGAVTMWAYFFLPVYFQGVLAATAYRSGIMLLPTILALLPAAILGGLLLTKFGRYKPILAASFALIVVGFGLFSILDENSSTGAWVGFQVLESFGAGLSLAALLPALLAPLTDKDTALATSTWAFMRSFGVMWGVAVAGTIYTNRASQLASSGAISSDAEVTAHFKAGGAYAAAESHYLDSLSAQTRAEVIAVQSNALRLSWQVAIGFGAVGLIAAAVMKQVPLRKENDTEFGMVDKEDKPTEEEAKSTVRDEATEAAS